MIIRQYSRLRNFQIRPWEMNGSGDIYEEDMVYMDSCQTFFNTYQERWQAQPQSSGSLIERMKDRKQRHGSS